MPVSLAPVRRILPGIERKFAGLTIETVTPDGSFSGYASLFGEVDLGKDAVEAGAFLKSVRERGPSGMANALRPGTAGYHGLFPGLGRVGCG